jgi:hypothetical protein
MENVGQDCNYVTVIRYHWVTYAFTLIGKTTCNFTELLGNTFTLKSLNYIDQMLSNCILDRNIGHVYH